MHESYNKYILL